MWKEAQEGTKEMILRDVQGRVVWKEKVVIEGNMMEAEFGPLTSGMYVLTVGEERLRLVVN
jgi:hypothetical protein